VNKWFLLAGAIASEVTATLALKVALDQPAWYVLVAAGYTLSFILIAACMRRGMGIGVAYGIWGACGVAITALLSAAIYSEPLTAVMGLGIVLIIGGVLIIEFGSQKALQDCTGHEATS
jgi:small multidrug resistance pump